MRISKLNEGILGKGTIYLVEDDDSLRNSLVDVLNYYEFHVLAFSSAESFLNTTVKEVPAVLITDMRLPNKSGIEIQAKLASSDRSLPIIFISGESSVSQSITAMKQGAIEFLIKPFETSDLLSAIERALENDKNKYKKEIIRNELNNNLKSLSPREREVYNLLARGFNNKELVENLSISLATVKQYKSEVMRKLNLKSLSELIRSKIEAN
jgi:FixJ family two-component response regulator